VNRPRRSLAVAAAATLWLLAAQPAWADNIRDQEWYLTYLHIPEAQQISQGDGVTVAVVDSGVNPNQPELAGNLLPGFDNVALDRGWSDDFGHGTAMSCLIAAHGTGASSGALGIAPKAKILPVKVGDDAETNNYDYIVQGIGWAVDHGAKVINLSFGAARAGTEEEKAVRDAIAADVVVVAGVGNQPEVSQVAYPAKYPGVVAVAGVDQNGNHADVSVTGPEVVLSAPAVDILAPHADGQYLNGTGTSDATAIVSGVAALVRAKYPNLSAAEVVHRLTATATDKGPPGRDDQYGYGIVNPVAALTADVPPLPPSPTASPTGAATSPTNIAAPRASSPTVLIGILVAVLVAAASVGLVILRARTRR